MTKCQVPRCGAPIFNKLFCCTRHWRDVPIPLRRHWSNAYADYLADAIGHPELEAIRRDIMAEVWGDAPPPGPRVGWMTCRRCGAVTAVAEHYHRADDGTYVPALAHVVLDTDGDHVVYAGELVHDVGFGPQYARFAFHECRGPKCGPPPRTPPRPTTTTGSTTRTRNASSAAA